MLTNMQRLFEYKWDYFSSNGAGIMRPFTWEAMDIVTDLTPFTKRGSTWMVDLNKKHSTLMLPDRSSRKESLHLPGLLLRLFTMTLLKEVDPLPLCPQSAVLAFQGSEFIAGGKKARV